MHGQVAHAWTENTLICTTIVGNLLETGPRNAQRSRAHVPVVGRARTGGHDRRCVAPSRAHSDMDTDTLARFDVLHHIKFGRL